MKFVLYHSGGFPPHYDLVLDSGVSAEIFRIPEDFFFDLVSGSPVEYEIVQATGPGDGPVSCAEGKVTVEDSGEFTRDNTNTMILKGGKISGKLVVDPVKKNITLIPG